MNIEEIQKYIKDNHITSDFENDHHPIDYYDTIGIKPMSKEKVEEIFEGLNEIVRKKRFGSFRFISLMYTKVITLLVSNYLMAVFILFTSKTWILKQKKA